MSTLPSPLGAPLSGTGAGGSMTTPTMRANEAYPDCTVSSTRISPISGPRRRMSNNIAAVTAPTVSALACTTQKLTAKPLANKTSSMPVRWAWSTIIVRRALYPSSTTRLEAAPIRSCIVFSMRNARTVSLP